MGMMERNIDYLRVSVTDRCNLRCAYCMPEEGIKTFSHDDILSFEEIVRLVRIFTGFGVRKIRITGGEPLVRKGIEGFIQNINSVPGIEEITLTTNGVLLPFFAEKLKRAGIKRLNISLDTLKPDKFEKITKKNFFSNVLEGIDKARALGFSPLKLNMVAMRGINEDEIINFVKFAIEKKIILRIIEFMELSHLWKRDLFISLEEIKNICKKQFKIEYVGAPGPGPAEYYKVDGLPLLGLIKTDQRNCNRCSRLRLTSVGHLKVCLYEEKGLSLKTLLKNGASDRKIIEAIKDRIFTKKGRGYDDWEPAKIYMCGIGG